MHVHSQFSDGKDSLEDNVRHAIGSGIKRLASVDHVRRNTTWLPAYVSEIRRVKARYDIELFAGVEAKILDESGRLDLPDDLGGIDWVYAADHRLAIGGDCLDPKIVKAALHNGSISVGRVMTAIVQSTIGAVQRYPNVVIAHLFSILPKLGLRECDVHPSYIEAMATALRNAGAHIEVDERWKCPNLRTISVFYRAGVPIRFGSDSHRKEKIGIYQHCASLRRGLSAL